MSTPVGVKNSPVLKRSDPLFEKKVSTQGFAHADEIVIRVLAGQRNIGQLVEEVVHVEVSWIQFQTAFDYKNELIVVLFMFYNRLPTRKIHSTYITSMHVKPA